MKDIGWKILKYENSNIYTKKLPFLGLFSKISRPDSNLNPFKLKQFKKENRIFSLKVSPQLYTDDNNYHKIKKEFLESGFSIENFPYNPVTTIYIDLGKSEEKIFNSFSSAKRRAVRKALKNNITVKESDDIDTFIKIRQKQFFPMGFLITDEMKALWKNFFPDNAALILAYDKFSKPLGGILLLFCNSISYYWYASSLREGKKLFAPSLLVWEALKLSKKRSCKTFDFEGIYDARFPKASESWRGFTKFKEGFGGKKAEFCENFSG